MLATVTTSAQTLISATSGASASYANQNGIMLRAPTTNSANIHFGKNSGVLSTGALTTGLTLEPGNSVKVPTSYAGDAALIFVISASGSQGLIWEVL